MNEPKPKLRGRIHRVAFVTTCCSALLYIITLFFHGWSTGFTVYILSQLVLYGISSTYHITEWRSERSRRLLQKMDHASIFFLIAGTQTCVALLFMPLTTTTKNILRVTWTISILGVLKVFFLKNVYETLDVVAYIVHGICILPFFRSLAKSTTPTNIIFFVCGGICYVVGGILFRIRRPDPYPSTFGYHEVFHMFTVVANLFCMVPIFKKYMSIFASAVEKSRHCLK